MTSQRAKTVELLSIFGVVGVVVIGDLRSGVKPRLPASRADALPTVLRGDGEFTWVLQTLLHKANYSSWLDNSCQRL